MPIKARSINSNNFRAAILLYLLWPFGATIFAIRHYRESWARWIVTLFCGFYGFTFIFWNDTADFNRHKSYFFEYTDYDFSVLWQRITTLFTSQATREDIAGDFICYAISRFTDDPRYLYAAFGLIFGYFYTKNIWLLLSYSQNKINKNALPFLIGFITIVPLFYISGFFMHVSMHIFFYGSFHVLTQRSYKHFGYVLLSIFFHWSFLFPALILIGLCAAGNRMRLYMIIFFVSLAINIINLEMFAGIASLFGSAIQSKYETYTNIDAVYETLKYETEQRSWFLIWRLKIWLYYAWCILVYLIYRFGKRLPYAIQILISFSLLIAAATNIFSAIPSMFRFYSLHLLLTMAALFMHYQRQNEQFFKKAGLLCYLPIVFWLIVLTRTHILGSVSPELFYSNIPGSLFFHNSVKNLGHIFGM